MSGTRAPRRIVLVGFMGAGKTTVGRLLAARLGLRFVDLDDEVEARTGRRVAELFAERGEDGFRAAEREAAAALATAGDCVLATGGGAWAQPATRALLARDAASVWLDAEFDTLLARLPDDGSRPLASTRATMRALFAQRLPAYALAQRRVNAAGPPEAVAREVLEALGWTLDAQRGTEGR